VSVGKAGGKESRLWPKGRAKGAGRRSSTIDADDGLERFGGGKKGGDGLKEGRASWLAPRVTEGDTPKGTDG